MLTFIISFLVGTIIGFLTRGKPSDTFAITTGKRVAWATFFLISVSPIASRADILLYSTNEKFHGCLDCSRYDSESVCNRYGTFGNKYSSESIWNRYGVGSRYDASSPFNRYGEGLKMLDRQGSFLGVFSLGSSGSRTMRDVLQQVWDSSNDDYDVMRDRFCDLDLDKLSTGAAPAPNVLNSSIRVVAKPRGCRGYFLADGDAGGVYLLEWYGGYVPAVGDSILGDLRSYGFKDVYYPSSSAKGRVYVDDYMLSTSRAREKLADKCR